MNKTLLIGGLVVLVAVAGIYFSFSNQKTQKEGIPAENTGQPNQNQEQNQGQTDINPSGAYTINELLTMNKPMKCTWKQSIEAGAQVTNIIYINGKNFYQDVTMGDMGHVYTVSDGDFLYIWNDFSDMASKMKYSEMQAASQQAQGKQNGGVDTNQKLDFLCEKWTVDNSFFVPPSDKNFTDITDEMTQAVGNLQQNAGEYQQQACDICRKAPSQELIDQCLKNMKCE